MGSDMYFNPPRDERKLWEKVRDFENELLKAKQTIIELNNIINDKSSEITALRMAIRSLKEIS